MKEMAELIENGQKVLLQVEEYFQENNKGLYQICEHISSQIQEFEHVVDLLIQVQDDSFKLEHWIKIFEVMYPQNEEKRQKINQLALSNQLTLEILLQDDILDCKKRTQNSLKYTLD
ncbi:hypothetical protein IMG5_169040 [Ichthyophthirius multifiliis]|uniref:Uncharacterized protein n=1 Tax=Ichthyophthirius multifiliis TaxID=5932 RepID=G0R183_ICHMU|nr:hypothetical protein IMG5_169040 [Ichthyophthirius multifiliis]EGR28768.1 hypothetical protein IMG5_169040 [Ichthyophthirius multifiliis]|eukprot:XP_004030004.1 hypothetical protein IMG5_169040 [Ichthyophthirius multifiliis]